MTAQELQAWRERHGLNRKQAGYILCVSPRTVEGYENGRTVPDSIARLISLMDSFEGRQAALRGPKTA